MNLRLMHADPSCLRCDLHTQAKSVGIPSRHLEDSLPVDSSAPLLYFLGRNPSYHEDLHSECFVGKSGAILLDGYIRPLALEKHATILLGNACRCYSTDDTPPNFPRQLRPCFESHTLTELLWLSRAQRPLYIVCLGEQATSALLRITLGRKASPQKEAFALNGHTFTTPELTPKTTKITIAPFTFTHISTYHPSAIYRAGMDQDGTSLSRYIFAVDSHMALLHRLLTTGARPLSEPTLIPPHSPRSALSQSGGAL